MAYLRTVKTSSGATAVQVVWSWRKGSRSIEHLGSAHDEVELAALKAAGAERLAAGQTELDVGISGHQEPGTLPILSSQMTALWEALCAAYRVLGFESATKGDNVFRGSQRSVVRNVFRRTCAAGGLGLGQKGVEKFPVVARDGPPAAHTPLAMLGVW